jgi:alpha-beta hydrolase superfamily lysophospholipase
LAYAQTDSAKATIILMHGIRAQKEHFAPIAKMLTVEGYNVFALDIRAHGESEGRFCTFGVKEKTDIKKLIDHLQQVEGIDTPFGIWGQSLGAAISLQAMAMDKRIGFGVIESTFSDFRLTANDYSKFYLGFNIPILTNYLVKRAGEIAEFNPALAKPSEACRNITQPMLMVHGDIDNRISINYGRENYNNLASQNKAFLELKGAAHQNVWEIGGEAYFEKVRAFFNSNSY